jgi:hypothetical protein
LEYIFTVSIEGVYIYYWSIYLLYQLREYIFTVSIENCGFAYITLIKVCQKQQKCSYGAEEFVYNGMIISPSIGGQVNIHAKKKEINTFFY